MKNILIMSLIILTAIILLFSACTDDNNLHSNDDNSAELVLDVMSFNIRLDVNDGSNSWPYRKPIVAEYLENRNPDIIGFQEALEIQVDDLNDMLPSYSWVGHGREENRQGEASPVFYNRNVFTLQAFDTFWLSENPNEAGSIGDGARLPRIVTWVNLEHNETGESVYIFNTHFSHVSQDARAFASSLMSTKMVDIANEELIIAMGDFNLEFESEEYNLLTDHFHNKNSLVDAMVVADTNQMGVTTFNGFSRERERIIDFIFVSDAFETQHFQIDEVIEDGVFISDHWPIWTRIKISQ